MTTAPLTITKPDAPAPAKEPEPSRTEPQQETKPTGKGSVSVFLRMPSARFEKLQQEAIERTKAAGKGVTVQQIILAKLEGLDA